MSFFRFVAREEDEGERVDRFVAERLAPLGVSRERVRGLLKEGRVMLGGDVPKGSRRLAEGEIVSVELPPPPPVELVPEEMPLRVLHEDEHLLVVDKEAGIVVHPTRGHATGTLVHGLLRHAGRLSSIGAPRRPGIVHRLDKGTSGVMVVAKDDPTHLALKSQFQARKVEKEYLTLCYGQMPRREGSLELPVGRSAKDRTRMSVRSSSGKAAHTDYRVLEELARSFSYLSVRPHTGRTHQIRVHLAAMGHPIVGDDTYAGARWKEVGDSVLRKAVRELGRPFLHAHELAFTHPATGERVSFRAELPTELEALLSNLRGAARKK
jgi:23S rRNA pseudouridine1911/1915/1917 synthase